MNLAIESAGVVPWTTTFQNLRADKAHRVARTVPGPRNQLVAWSHVQDGREALPPSDRRSLESRVLDADSIAGDVTGGVFGALSQSFTEIEAQKNPAIQTIYDSELPGNTL